MLPPTNEGTKIMYDIAVIIAARNFIQRFAGATRLDDPAAAMAIAEAHAPGVAAIAAEVTLQMGGKGFRSMSN